MALSTKHKKTLIICSTVSTKYLFSFKKDSPDNLEVIDALMYGATVGAMDGTLGFMEGWGRRLNHRIGQTSF